jgi:hypothetical protein
MTQLHGVSKLRSWNSVVGDVKMQSWLCSGHTDDENPFSHLTRRRVSTSGVAAMRNKTRKLIHFKCIITGCTKCCWVPDVTRRTWCDSACPTAWHWWAGVPSALYSIPDKHKFSRLPPRSSWELRSSGLEDSFFDSKEDGGTKLASHFNSLRG